MERAIKVGRWGIAEDIREQVVTMRYQGRDLLGRINRHIPIEKDFVTGTPRLNVSFFCGDPWPIRPAVSAVKLLVEDCTTPH